MPAHPKIRSRPLAWLAAAVACAPLALFLSPSPASAQPLKAAGPATPADFADCLSRLRPAAVAKGVTGPVFDSQTAALAPDMSILPLLDAQPEFVTPIWDYLAALVDDERVADGRQMLERWRKVLAQVEDQYGVDPATVVAVWGVESNFGRNFGKRPLLTSLSTLSCYGRRQAYFQGEFFTTLKIIQDGDIAPDRLNGSWAGAFGHTQFMPSTFMRLAVDFDGDGRRDLIDSVPDALASTANFLLKAGWRSNEPWGFEVKLPPGFDASDAGRRNKRPLSAWAARGVKRVDGAALTDNSPRSATSGSATAGSIGAAGGSAEAATPLDEAMPAALLLPAGPKGPAFLVMRNFDAIYSYNDAESYALAIAHLSDRLRGGAGFATPWPTDDPGLSRAERRELQSLLIARGHDIGEIDGMLGGRTREALKAAQADLGLEADGHAGQKALAALRAAAATAR
ncbi:MAG: lytic murein transglycosylase [Gammaproteobacteria bacterium]